MREISSAEIDAIGGGSWALVGREIGMQISIGIAYDYLKEGWRRFTVWVDENGKILNNENYEAYPSRIDNSPVY